MKRFFFFLLLVCVGIAQAQNLKTKQAGWQQRVDYKISVTLDDDANTLSAFETVTYHNQSPDALSELYFHLWPNAYKNDQTAFAKQHLENGSTDFYFSPEEDRGYIDSLDFYVNGQKQHWQYTEHIDICVIKLTKPVNSGQTIIITTPFRVKMPKVFSRMGHQDQLYCVTQWFPKPAVYDVNGWNPMPYLDQGEFYSEFGSFDVSITTPKDYVVVATGMVQELAEVDWWLSRTGSNNINHPSPSPQKTLRFIQDSIHDFAWFASKKFKAEKSEVTLASGKKVATWYFDENNQEGVKLKTVEHINAAIKFYSEKVGEYPYPLATAVRTPLLAGGGMEYPTITNVSQANRQVIVHEVGHNWFYGILGSNERQYPWMDESINNYYEARSDYEREIAEHKGLSLRSGKSKGIGLAEENFAMHHLEYLISARRNDDQKPTLPSEEFTEFNYGTIVYGKAALAFHYLQQYLGDSLFDAMMQAYYEKWKFRHPLPDDFIHHAKQFTGKELNWFFNDVMSSNEKMDLSAKKITKTEGGYWLKIRNKSDIKAPFPVTGLKGQNDIVTKWFEGFEKDTQVFLPVADYDRLRIDAYEFTTEVYRSNNTIRTRGLFKKNEPVRFRFLGNVEDPYSNTVFYAPLYGANLYNKSMLGLAFYNSILPRKKTEYVFAPMYAFGTRDLAGYLNIERYFSMRGAFKEMSIGLNAARFGNEHFMTPATYEKIDPFIRFYFAKPNPRTDANRHLMLRYMLISEGPRSPDLLKHFDKANAYLTLSYHHDKARQINPYSWSAKYQFGNTSTQFGNRAGQFHRLSAEAKQFYHYGSPKKGFSARVFAGTFLQKPTGSDGRVYFRNDNTGQFDYQFDEAQFGRSEGSFSESMFRQQLMPGEAEFKVIQGIASTDSWLVSANFSSTLPGIFPLRPFVDMMLIDARSTEINGNTGEINTAYTPTFYYVGGISLVMFNEILSINFPITASQVITDLWNGGANGTGPTYGYGERISFTFKLNKLNPLKAIKDVGK